MSDQLTDDLASLRIDRSVNPNRRNPLRFVLYAAAAVGLALLIVFVALPYAKGKMFKAAVAVTEVFVVSPAQAQVTLTATGYVVPTQAPRVAAKVSGKVSKVNVHQGSTVTAGDVLFEIDQSDQAAAIAAAQSRAAAAYARMRTARATMAAVKLQADRAHNLSERGVAPKSRAVDLGAQLQLHKAQIGAAQAEARAAQAEVKALKVNSTGYVVRAPITGTVINKPPELGEYVGPASFGSDTTTGTIEIADLTQLVVETDVPESRLHLVTANGPAEITLDAFPGKRFRGTTLEVIPKVNRAKATVTIKVGFSDPTTNVLPEMSARVSFLSKALAPEDLKKKAKRMIPALAVTERAGGKVTFVVNDGRVRIHSITVGPLVGDAYELLEGPPPGTRVVKKPESTLQDGQAVKEDDK